MDEDEAIGMDIDIRVRYDENGCFMCANLEVSDPSPYPREYLEDCIPKIVKQIVSDENYKRWRNQKIIDNNNGNVN